MSTVIDTPEGIAMYQMLAIRAALRIEVNTGLRHSRGSVMKLAKRLYGCKRNTKKGVLKELDKMIEARMPSDTEVNDGP